MISAIRNAVKKKNNNLQKGVKCDIVEIGNLLTKPQNFVSSSDLMVFVKFEQAENCGVYMNSRYENNIVAILNTKDYMIEGQTLDDIDLFKNYNPEMQGRIRTFNFSRCIRFKKF